MVMGVTLRILWFTQFKVVLQAEEYKYPAGEAKLLMRHRHMRDSLFAGSYLIDFWLRKSADMSA